jgi:NADH-quinone oxidoreductase subunit N
MLAAVIAAYVYLRIVVAMYFAEDDGSVSRPVVPFGAGVALGAALVVTVVAGFWPGSIIDLARDAIPALVTLG